MLEIILPETLVLSSVHMLVDTPSIGFVVGPVAVIDVAIDVNESTFTVGSVLTPLAAVFGPI